MLAGSLMRYDLRLFGRLDDGRECQADISIYVKEDQELFKLANEAAGDAPWLLKEKGWPDVPDNANITIERVEHLNKPKEEPIPGSFPALMKKLGVGEFMFPNS